MSEKGNKNNDETVLLQRLDRLEDEIRRHDDLQKRLKTISLGGIFLVLFFFTLFMFRLVGIVRGYAVDELITHMRNDSVEIVRPELDLFLSELRGEIIPTFSEKLNDEFKAEMPALKGAALDLAKNLEEKIKKRVEERILETMISSLENSEDDIKAIFPEFTPEDLEKQIGQSMGYYIEKLHDSIEERIAKVSGSLESLKNTAKQIGSSPGLEHLHPENETVAEEKLLDALLDLIIYEIKPQLGNDIAE